MNGKIEIADCDIAVLVMDSLAGMGTFMDANARTLRRILAKEIMDNHRNPEITVELVSDAVTIAQALNDMRPVTEWSKKQSDERTQLLFWIFNNLDTVHNHEKCLSRAILEFDNGE